MEINKTKTKKEYLIPEVIIENCDNNFIVTSIEVYTEKGKQSAIAIFSDWNSDNQ